MKSPHIGNAPLTKGTDPLLRAQRRDSGRTTDRLKIIVDKMPRTPSLCCLATLAAQRDALGPPEWRKLAPSRSTMGSNPAHLCTMGAHTMVERAMPFFRAGIHPPLPEARPRKRTATIRLSMRERANYTATHFICTVVYHHMEIVFS